MKDSKIEWTDTTWNPVTGCTKVSAGCKNCYAERMTKRLQAMGQSKYKNGFAVTLHEQIVQQPLGWKKPSYIFVNSMSDLFHKEVPESFIVKLFETMNKANWHVYQILTKRPDRMDQFQQEYPSLMQKHIWMGTSVENMTVYKRVVELSFMDNIPIKFLSCEPLLGPIHFDERLKMIDWVIAGGESGPNSRLMEKGWVEEIQHSCLDYEVPFFFKQWGGPNKAKTGRLLNGQLYDAMPYTL